MRRLLFAAALVFAITSVTSAQKVVSASKAWIKAPAAGETTASGYVVVDNPTMYDVYVVSATSDAAGAITFEDASKAVDSITAPAYDSIELKPGGLHLVLKDLKRELKPGDKVSITLATDSGIAFEAVADVKAQ